MKLSRRFTWEARPNALATARAEVEASGRRLLDLTRSNPTSAGIPYPPDLLAGLADPRALRYEPSAAGLRLAREAVAEYYQDHGAAVHPDQVMLTASTSEAYQYLFKLMTDPGDEILVPRPSYPLFDFLAGMEFVAAVPYANALADPCNLATDRTKALITVHPNNPTGEYLPAAKIRSLVSHCAALGIGLIADEVFLDYGLLNGQPETFAKNAVGHTFVLSGLSKICGLPQMKLGWMVLAGDHAPDVRERLELIADTYLSVSAPIQWASIDWLRRRDEIQAPIRHRLQTNSRLLQQKLRSSPLLYQPPEGGWSAVVQLPGTVDEEVLVLRMLREHSVLIQPGYFYDFDGVPRVVISLLSSPEDLDQGIETLKAAI